MTPAAAASAERLNRFLARRGVASRRAADQLIAAGRVRVNGSVAEVGAKVDINADTVEVDGAVVAADLPGTVTLALNKPAGVLTTMSDPQRRPTVRDLVPDIAGLVPVGRLDADSRGLLLLTNDGELAHRVAHPRHGVHKTYRVTAAAALTDAQLEQVLAGVVLDDGIGRALEVRRIGASVAEVVMGEGRKRLVRRSSPPWAARSSTSVAPASARSRSATFARGRRECSTRPTSTPCAAPRARTSGEQGTRRHRRRPRRKWQVDAGASPGHRAGAAAHRHRPLLPRHHGRRGARQYRRPRQARARRAGAAHRRRGRHRSQVGR